MKYLIAITAASLGSQEAAVIMPNNHSVISASCLPAMISSGEIITDEVMAEALR